MSTSTSERQSNLDQTLTSVISLLENEQTLKKVRLKLTTKMNGADGNRQSEKHWNLLMISQGELLENLTNSTQGLLQSVSLSILSEWKHLEYMEDVDE
jgi:hypothetical protein